MKMVAADLVRLIAIVVTLEELADRGGVGLTSQAVAIDRALATVSTVNDTIDKDGLERRDQGEALPNDWNRWCDGVSGHPKEPLS
jgi:hypothetical protein